MAFDPQKQLADANAKLQRLERLAAKYGTRVEPKQSTAEIHRKIKMFEQNLSFIVNSNETLDDVRDKMEAIERELKENDELVATMLETSNVV